MCLYFLVPGAMTGLHIRFVADHEDQISCINIIFYRVNTILHFTQCSVVQPFLALLQAIIKHPKK